MIFSQQNHILPNYYDLESLFISNPQKAIEESQEIIFQFSNFESYKEFLLYHHDHSHISTCQKAWQQEKMSIHCFDCSTSSSSCLCLDCFLNGNHQGHNYSICPDTVGNCDCGDISQWMPTGFCKNHQGTPDDSCPEDYLDEELRSTLTDFIFKAAFSALPKLDKNQDTFAKEIFQFVSSFLQFGDGFRRLIAISLTEKIDFPNLLSNIIKYTPQINELLQQLCANLMNDQIFKRNFSKATYDIIFDLLKNQYNPNVQFWFKFFHHSFSPKPIIYNISHNHWDWVSFWIKIISEMKEFFNYVGNENFSKNYPDFLQPSFTGLTYATSYQPHEQTQQFFDRLFSEVLNCGTKESPKSDNTIIPASFKGTSEKAYYLSAQKFIVNINNAFSCFKFKKDLKYDVLIEQLKKHTDISPIYRVGNDENENQKENDKYILKYMKNDFFNANNENVSDSDGIIMYPYIYYESFHNGASFFFYLPLYESLVNIFGLENICRISIARLLLAENDQQLRLKLAIITLKKILSFALCGQSLTPLNFGLIRMIKLAMFDPEELTIGIPKYFPLFQLLIGLQCTNEKEEFSMKDFFAFEMAREIGLFDDFQSSDYDDENIKETQEKMDFSFLYISLLLVVERILFNFDCDNFIREQLVHALKKGVTNLNELSSCYDKRVLNDFDNPANFDKVLFDIATIKTRQKSENIESNENGEKDISFALKENVKWNTISAIIPFTEQKAMLNKEISKHPDQLIDIQEFKHEEDYFFNAPLFSPSSLSSKTFNSKSADDNDEEKANYEGLKVRLNEFLLTPTVLAVVYHSMRTNSPQIDLNDHISLNILILISKFLHEKENNDQKLSIDEDIEYDNLSELIQKLRNVVFKYSVDEEGNAAIENTIVNVNNFTSLLNLKISYKKEQAKSFIDVIREKGEIGKNALELMKVNSNMNDTNDNNNAANEKMAKKQRANKIKEEIMNQYNNIVLNYRMSDHRIIDSSGRLEITESVDSFYSPTCSGIIKGLTEVCSVCSTNKKNELLSYPIFIFQTKLPFIFDKPPLVKGRANEITVTCDDDADYDFDEEEVNQNDNSENRQENNNDENRPEFTSLDSSQDFVIGEPSQENANEGNGQNDVVDQDEVEMAQLRELERRSRAVSEMISQISAANADGTLSREEIINAIASFEQIRQEMAVAHQLIERNIFIRRLKRKKQQQHDENHQRRMEEFANNPDRKRRITAGANFVVQFSLCQHLIHPKCAESDVFHCPIDRTVKNGFLPCFDALQKGKPLSNQMIDSINVFLNSFRKVVIAASDRKVDLFVELVKSLSGLITTYEIRLRSLPVCLDSNNTMLLSRNLFLSAWHAYRIQGKPVMRDFKPYHISHNEGEGEEEDAESRLTVFQRFIKKLIECDEIDDNGSSFKKIVDSFIAQIKNEQKERSERSEKELLLFLRRVCLADHFLLGNEVQSDNGFSLNNEYIEWDDVLSIQNISKKYNTSFTILNGDFEFKPFFFSKLPKEFIQFATKPYNFPIEMTKDFTFYSLINYNHLIDNYDELGDDEYQNEILEAETYDNDNVRIELALNHNLKHYPSALLLVGKFASRILVVYDSFTTTLNPFFLDKYGSPDFGFARGQPLFLNEERYERVIDEILSGDFANYIS